MVFVVVLFIQNLNVVITVFHLYFQEVMRHTIMAPQDQVQYYFQLAHQYQQVIDLIL